MRLIILMAALLSTLTVEAKIRSFEMKNLHLNFNQNNGRASADLFNLTFDFGVLNLDGYDIDITKGEDYLYFAKSDTNFRLNNIDESVLAAFNALSAERIDIQGVANKSLKLDFKNGAISLGDEIHGLEKLTLDCFTNTRGDDTLVSFLIPCFDKGDIDIPLIRLSQKSAEALLPLWQSTPANYLVEQDKLNIFIPKKLEDIRMRIVEQRFEMSLRARFIFKLTLRMKGTAELNQKKDIIVLNLSEAKIGFINVKNIIVKLLSKLEVTNIIVEGSTVTIKL